jgi:hypothetical protein
MSSEFGKEWFFSWAKGTIKGYLRHRIELNRAKGMLKTAINNIGEKKISLIFKNLKENPVYLSTISTEEKLKMIELLKKELNLN